jgi:hypothetical protein
MFKCFLALTINLNCEIKKKKKRKKYKIWGWSPTFKEVWTKREKMTMGHITSDDWNTLFTYAKSTECENDWGEDRQIDR